jgi:hypothetical protein
MSSLPPRAKNAFVGVARVDLAALALFELCDRVRLNFETCHPDRCRQIAK